MTTEPRRHLDKECGGNNFHTEFLREDSLGGLEMQQGGQRGYCAVRVCAGANSQFM